MSSEQRDIRPYVGVDALEHAIASLRVHVASSVLADKGRTSLATNVYLTEPVVLQIADQPHKAQAVVESIWSAVDGMGLDRRDVELIVVASSRRLKLSEIVTRIAVADLTAGPIELAHGQKRPTALQAPFGGCVLDVYLALGRRLEPAPLRPWRAGTWLARARFTIVTEFGEVGFTPFPLDDAERERLKLPEAVTRFVEVDSPLDPSTGLDSVRLYVDPVLLSAMTASPYSPGAKALQRQLYLDVLAAVVMADDVRDVAGDDEERPTYDAIDGSLLARIVDRVAGIDADASKVDGVASSHRDSLLRAAFVTPGRFLALAETTVPDLKKILEASVMEAS